GNPVVVIDSPSLVIPGTPNKYVTLGLTERGVEAVDTESPYTAATEQTEKENIFVRLKSEWAYNIGVKGFRYNTSAGVNPDAATVASSASWVKNVTDNKSTAGVRLVTQ